MATTTFEQVNTKLKNLPDSVLEEVENFIEFLAYKHAQSALEIPQWHKEIVSKRIEDNKKPVDAFEMLDNLDV